MMQSPREPRSLKEIVRVERRVHDTISEAWVRISERDQLCGSPFIIDFPFHQIARQCSKAGQEMGAKKRRAPPDDRAVEEMLSQDGGERLRATSGLFDRWHSSIRKYHEEMVFPAQTAWPWRNNSQGPECIASSSRPRTVLPCSPNHDPEYPTGYNRKQCEKHRVSPVRSWLCQFPVRQ